MFLESFRPECHSNLSLKIHILCNIIKITVEGGNKHKELNVLTIMNNSWRLVIRIVLGQLGLEFNLFYSTTLALESAEMSRNECMRQATYFQANWQNFNNKWFIRCTFS